MRVDVVEDARTCTQSTEGPSQGLGHTNRCAVHGTGHCPQTGRCRHRVGVRPAVVHAWAFEWCRAGAESLVPVHTKLGDGPVVHAFQGDVGRASHPIGAPKENRGWHSEKHISAVGPHLINLGPDVARAKDLHTLNSHRHTNGRVVAVVCVDAAAGHALSAVEKHGHLG